MDVETLIRAEDFCGYHRIETAFLQSLHDYGMIELTTAQEACFLHPEQLSQAERFVRLHRDLQINLEGLHAVNHLLLRMESMQREMAQLRNRLRFYEGLETEG